MTFVAAVVVLGLGAGVLAIHPSRPLYMQQRPVALRAPDGVVLHGTLSRPRWRRAAVPGMVIVHGSGPLTRDNVRGDMRALVRLGFAVLTYDKRGTGRSGGIFLRQWGDAAPSVLAQLAADAAVALDSLRAANGVDTARVGFLGASQAGWIIPLAAERAQRRPRFHVLLASPAVSTGVEQYYSDLSGDGSRPAQLEDRRELEARVLAYTGPRGYDPAPVLAGSTVPTLWLLGERDQSVPTFASRRVLDSLARNGVSTHTVVSFRNANHFLVEVDRFEGERSRIELSDASGAPLRLLYCIATRNEKTGVLQFVDYGYETLEDARAAWPNASERPLAQPDPVPLASLYVRSQ